MSRDPEKIVRDDVVLVVVDVQEKLYPHIAGNEGMATEIIRLARFAKVLGIPVLHMEQIKLGPTIAPISSHLGEEKAIIKSSFGGFGCAEFVEAVGAHRRNTLILCGIETHVCVLQTAMEGLKRGMRVQVVADAVGSRSPYNKEVALNRIRAAGGEVTCAESVIFELMGRAGTEEFKEVLSLLK